MKGRQSLTSSEPPIEGSRTKIATDVPGGMSEYLRDSNTDLRGSNTDGGGEEGDAQPELELAAGMTESEWLQTAQLCFKASTTWFETSVQPQVARNYAHFQSRHAPGSKYLHEYYRLRSQSFRPKTRAMVRRFEAALAVALFSTSDLLEIEAYDDTSEDQRDSAEVAKAIIQYRLEKSIPWFLTIVGAGQESAIHNRPIARIEWKYRTRTHSSLKLDSESGHVEWAEDNEVLEDRPWIDLVPIERLRFDPNADWRDPVNASPYLFELMPMFVGDVKKMARSLNAEYGGQWYRELDDAQWWSYSRKNADAVRSARQGGQQDPIDLQRGTPDAEVIWITRCFFRKDDTDWTFDMIDQVTVLSIPRPVEEILPHLEYGKRPYVVGMSALEAFKAYPTSAVGMTEESQREINEMANLQQDGVRMSVLRRWLLRRGSAVDMETLKYGAANSVIVTEDPERDVKELASQDIPSSAFQTSDRVSNSFDEVAGNFSQASVANQRQLNETVGGMNLLSGDAAQVKEYEIRTFCETFVEPVLNQVYALEQFYESDHAVLQEICTRSGLDLNRVLDVLEMKLHLKVNVGFNSTSPERRIQRISMGVKTIGELAPDAQQGLNVAEIVKEVFGALGYKNGARFYSQLNGKGDPEKQALMQKVQQLQQMLAGRQVETQGKIEVAKINVQGRLQLGAITNQSRERIAELQAQISLKELQLQEIDRQLAAQAQDTDRMRLANERDVISNDIQTGRVKLMTEVAALTNPQTPGRGGKPGGRPKPAAASQAPAPMSPATGHPAAPAGPPAQPAANTVPDLPGNKDAAGTLARGRYGDIPFHEG